MKKRKNSDVYFSSGFIGDDLIAEDAKESKTPFYEQIELLFP